MKVSPLLWRLHWTERNGKQRRRSFSSNKALLQCARQIVHKAFTFRLEALSEAEHVEEITLAVRAILTGSERSTPTDIRRAKIAKWIAAGMKLGVEPVVISRSFLEDADTFLSGQNLTFKYRWKDQ
jgi:hypothetical protein